MEFIVAPILLLLFLYLFGLLLNKKDEIIRKELKPILSKIEEFNQLFNTLKLKRKYISSFEIFNFKNETKHIYNLIKTKKYKYPHKFESSIKKINTFRQTYESIESIINSRNENFIDSELKNTNSLLSDIEGKSLDNQQRKAVIIDEDNQLVIAGAGSGKTTTIAGKVKYLTTIQDIKPQSILLISFTRKAADEMRDRIFNKMNIDIPVKTFNKLGLDIIAQVNNLKPSIYDANGKSHLERISSFIDHAKESEEYYNLLIDFISYYLKPYKDIAEFETDEEHNNYLNEQKLEGYKIIEKRRSNGQVIRYRERLKSQEEVFIANFLFRNGINYEYEDKYPYKTASKQFGQYKPDFYLPDYDVYIEHFGVDENWNVPDWFKGKDRKSAKEVYNEGIKWKRQEHRNNSTTLVESYSWQQKKGILLPELKKNLEEVGVVFNPLSNDKLWLILKENASKDISDFTQLLGTFLTLLKSNNEAISNLKKRAFKEDNDRAIKFLELFEPIYHSYQEYLIEEEEIDFSDMINNATKVIQDNLYQSQYDYIIIDEYQDISKARFQLIKSLLDQKPSTKLFCVGDDWQSIYRFTGSDIGLFTNFEKHFKSSTVTNYSRVTQTSFIEYTYRFDNQLINLSSNFILKNPNQISKKLKSHHKSEEVPYSIFKYSDPERKSIELHLALRSALDHIAEKSENNDASVLLLGRYDFERRNFLNGGFLIELYNKISNQYEYIYNEFPNLKIRFLTAHRSKGLEDDYVIVTNCSSGTYGFPSEISDDPLLNFLLSKADQFPNGEERRLFYVAMTRAKKHVSFLVNNDYTSKFIDEIEVNEKITELKCNWCDIGKLIERNGKFGYFYACNNNHYCNYTRKITANDFEILAYEYYAKEEFKLAIEYFENYISLQEGNSDSYYYLGRSYEQNSDLKNALINYEKAIAQDSSNAYAHYWCGSVHFDLENYNKSLEYWLKLNKLKPNWGPVNLCLGRVYLKLGYFFKSIHHLNIEIKVKKDTVDSNSALLLRNKLIDSLKERFTSKESNIKSTDLESTKICIQLAIDFEVNIKFNYHKSKQFEGGIESLRTIKPKGFKVMGMYNSVCVFGYCYMREEERIFNIERISDLKINPNEIEFNSK